MAHNLNELKSEIATDPGGRGYVGMTDAQAATDLELKRISVDKATMTADEFLQCLVQSEYNSLTQSQRDYINLVISAGNAVKCDASSLVRTGMLAIFGAGTTTRTNLAAAVQKQISRSVELFGSDLVAAFGYPSPTATVAAARALP